MALAYYDDDQKPSEKLVSIFGSGLSKAVGLFYLALGVALILMIVTFSFDDPSPLNNTGGVATNALGAPGAWISALLLSLVGRAVWLLPIVFIAWALRVFAGRPTRHFFNRFVFLPVGILIWAGFAATHSVSANWPFAEYGMGGDIGDQILGFAVSLSPFGLSTSLFVISILFGIMAFLSGAFISGVHRHEIRGLAEKILDDMMIVSRALYRGLRHLVAWITAMIRNLRSPKAATASATTNESNAAPAGKAAAVAASGAALGGVFSRLKRSRMEAPMEAEPKLAGASAELDEQPSSLSERIRNIAARNKANHDEMVKRSINGKQEPSSDIALMDDDLVEPSLSPIADSVALDTAREPIVSTSHKTPKLSARAAKETQPSFTFDESASAEFEKPSIAMLQSPETISRVIAPREALEASARQLEAVLDDYGIKGEIVAVRPGPVVTLYELEPAAGLKASRVIGLSEDIARSMSALSARVSTIPGRTVISIELPNETREMVLLREIFSAKIYGDSTMPLPLALGKDIAGEPIVANLAKMPHLLIAGTTGSGKSVAINTMILSLLYHASPEEVRMIMIDPKMLELSVYDDIPHLLSPVVTDPKKAVVALKWVVSEMEERYRKMSKMGVRNIDGYNGRVQAALDKGEDFTRTVQTGFDDLTGEPVFETESYAPEKMPYIVVIVDEMADLMMVAGKEIEACIQRLAQMARASGIHLIMATQRPSVDVITGTIKANFPTRISFQVTSKIDSRTILGEMGAEQLLGQGDMLFMEGGGRVTRIHGPFVSDREVEEIVRHLKAQGEPVYVSGVVEGPEDEKASDIDAVLGLSSGNDGDDALYDQAVMIVARDRKCSTSYIQRKLSVGYNKAATIVERLEENNVVSAANHVGKRDILVPEMN